MTEDTDKKVQFLPFHALNEFMTHEYRLEVVRTALNALPEMGPEHHKTIDRLVKKVVVVPGFRNAAKAPAQLKIRPMAQAFEKSPEVVTAILAIWAEHNSLLRSQMHEFLTNRGWELLPIEADRTRLPGFISVWPKKEGFDAINTAFAGMHPEVTIPVNDIALMAVWVSGRLPYTLSGDDEADETADE